MPHLILLIVAIVVGLWFVRELARTAVLLWNGLLWVGRIMFRLVGVLVKGTVWLVFLGQRTMERHAHRSG